MINILITGATGFVGRALTIELHGRGYNVVGGVRRLSLNLPATVRQQVVENLSPDTDWFAALQDIDMIIHTAARVHIMQDDEDEPLAAFRQVNTAGTEHLAREAAKAGVRRFVYLSSIKVNGENTGLGPEDSGLSKKNEQIHFSETDTPNPKDPYSVSKWEAEQLLHDIAVESGMEVVIIRPPLVYGPGVKANFLRLLQFAEKRIPLPFAGICNKRSLIALDNLVDFILCCLEHPAAAGETFLVSDGEDLSTPELIKRIAFHMGRSARLFPVPVTLMQLGAKLTGKTGEVDRLCGSLQVDISKAKRVLGWKPPFSVDEGLAKTVEWFVGRGVKNGK